MTRRAPIFILLCFTVCVCSLHGFEVGVFVAKTSQEDSLEAGFWGGMGLLLPMFKLEVEIFPAVGTTRKGISAGLKFRPRFGSLAPYAIVGAGTFMEELVFDFSLYQWHTFVGGGVNVFIRNFLSLRLDLRIFSFSNETVPRFAAGLMVHI